MIESFEKTKIAGSIAAGALDEVNSIIKPGLSTKKIDDLPPKIRHSHWVTLTEKQKNFYE